MRTCSNSVNCGCITAMGTAMELTPEEIAKLQAAFDKVKDFPESRPTGWADMLALRQVVEHILMRAPPPERR